MSGTSFFVSACVLRLRVEAGFACGAGALLGRLFWFVVFSSGCVCVGGQMLPQTILVPFKLVGEPLAALALHQALALAVLVDDHYAHFRIDLAFAVPIAACRADLKFSGKNQFLAHDQ